MGLLDDARARIQPDESDDGGPPAVRADVGTLARREATVTVDGEAITVDSPETTQTGEEGTWLSGASKFGRPRGADALENRQIVQTSAMQAIANGITNQLLGGDLTFQSDEDAVENEAADLRDLLRDVLTGPHLGGESLDDLVTAAVEDMLGPGNAYWQILPAENADLPVAALTSLDPLTIRKNVNRHGVPQDPPYWQATNAFGGGGVSALGAVDPVPLSKSQLIEFSYPRGHRSYTVYPKSPAWQVKEWLKILANSTTHHNRFYSDNEIPPGLIQIINASENTVTDVKDKIQEASGDPRDVPIIGGEGGAQWLDMGGTAVNLAVVEEQRWFFFLCLGSLGLGKQELGFIEDVNRSNGEVESTRVYKNVTGPFLNQFEDGFLKVARQFDAYERLGEPFTPTLSFTDPREERAREQRLREMWQADGLTLKQYYRKRGDEDLADDDERFEVEIGGELIDYGEHPRFVVSALLSAAGADVDVDTPSEGDDPDPEDSTNTLGVGPANPGPQHNGGEA